MFIIQGLFLLAQFKDKLYKLNNHAQRDSVFSVLREYYLRPLPSISLSMKMSHRKQ